MKNELHSLKNELQKLLGDEFSVEESNQWISIFYGNRKIAIVRPGEYRIWFSQYGNPVSYVGPVDVNLVKLATQKPSYYNVNIRGIPTIIERTSRTERGLGVPDLFYSKIVEGSSSLEEAFGKLWNSPHSFGVTGDGKIVDHPNYFATLEKRDFGAPIGRRELVYAILSIDTDTVPDRQKNFVLGFIDSIRKANKGGWDLSPRQIEVARDIIGKYAPDEIADRLGCKKPKSIATFDTFVIETSSKIDPFMAADRNWFSGFRSSISGRESLTEGQRNIALKFISNYRDQLDLETLNAIYHHLPEQEDFFKKYNLATIKMMVAALRSAVASGSIILDQKSERFVNTNGFGEKDTRYETWRNIVEHVHDRMIKLSNKGKMGDFSDYINDPDLLKSMIDNETIGESTKSDRVDSIINNISNYKQKTYSKEQKMAGLEIVKILSSNCDGAIEEDGSGFSKAHTKHGKKLALLSFEDLTDSDMNTISFFSKYYHRQIPKYLEKIVNSVAEKENNAYLTLLESICY